MTQERWILKPMDQQLKEYIERYRGYIVYPEILGPQTEIPQEVFNRILIDNNVNWPEEFINIPLGEIGTLNATFDALFEQLVNGHACRMLVNFTNLKNAHYIRLDKFGPLVDLDIVLPVCGGAVIMRQPYGNDKLGLAHKTTFYAVAFTYG